MRKFYSGVGSRSTPLGACNLMRTIAGFLEKYGYVLRSGGAVGADQAFESGVKNPENKEIFYIGDSTDEAERIAAKIHPAWDKCSPLVRKLHGRNIFQVLGKDLISPSEFLVCWTPEGKPVGGTRTAIVLAERHRIPVFNLALPDAMANLDAWIGSKLNENRV